MAPRPTIHHVGANLNDYDSGSSPPKPWRNQKNLPDSSRLYLVAIHLLSLFFPCRFYLQSVGFIKIWWGVYLTCSYDGDRRRKRQADPGCFYSSTIIETWVFCAGGFTGEVVGVSWPIENATIKCNWRQHSNWVSASAREDSPDLIGQLTPTPPCKKPKFSRLFRGRV